MYIYIYVYRSFQFPESRFQFRDTRFQITDTEFQTPMFQRATFLEACATADVAAGSSGAALLFWLFAILIVRNPASAQH